MEDDFYEASSERFIKPTSRQQEKAQQEKAAFERERPLVTAVIKHLKEQIAFREKLDSITETKDPEAFMREVNVNKQVCDILKRDLRLLETKAKMFDKGELQQVAPVMLPTFPGGITGSISTRRNRRLTVVKNKGDKLWQKTPKTV